PRNNFNRSENGGEGGYRPRNNFNRSENGGEGGYRPRREGSGEFKPRNNFNGERSFGGSEGGYRQNRDSRPFNNRYSDDNRSSFNSTEGENTQPEPLINREIRLNRYIAMSGICSRREADTIIAEGLISVNEEVVTELGTKIKMTDVVKHNGEVIRGEKKVYIVMNKPKGFITTVEDIHAERTVIDLLKGNVNERVYPVGRLDKNTMGVLLLTNDGDLTKALTHPSYNRKKIYHVFLDKNISEADMERIAQGVELEDGIAYADEISIIGGSHKEIGIEIHNGRNRIVRRLFEHFGYKIMKLDRVYFAGITKKGLQRGFWRHLTTKEVQQLYKKS
ncbi:MAG: pseudouridine synthase, partial [Rikenellaceae bacterium]